LDFETLRCEIDGPIAQITLQRPANLNALTPRMLAELREGVSALADKRIRCLILTGAGRGFCVGADLVDVELLHDEQGGIDLGLSLERDFNPTVRALARAPFPTLAAVNGPCVGAGMSLALACDVTLAARAAYFCQAFTNVGLVPDSGSTFFLPRLVGSARAAGMVLLGGRISAEQAAAWGLVWRCVDDAALLSEARDLARQLVERPTTTLVLCRQALIESSRNDLDQQLDLERNLQRITGRTHDTMEGIRAFAEKRKPRFLGS